MARALLDVGSKRSQAIKLQSRELASVRRGAPQRELPACTLNTQVLRVLCRSDFGPNLASELVEDLHKAIKWLDR